MNTLYKFTAIVPIFLLAACGGNSSSPIPATSTAIVQPQSTTVAVDATAERSTESTDSLVGAIAAVNAKVAVGKALSKWNSELGHVSSTVIINGLRSLKGSASYRSLPPTTSKILNEKIGFTILALELRQSTNVRNGFASMIAALK